MIILLAFVLSGIVLVPDLSYAAATGSVWSLYLMRNGLVVAKAGNALFPIQSLDGLSLQELVVLPTYHPGAQTQVQTLKSLFGTTAYYDCSMVGDANNPPECPTVTHRNLPTTRFDLCSRSPCATKPPPVTVTPVLSAMGEPQWEWYDKQTNQVIRFPVCQRHQLMAALGIKGATVTSWMDGMQAGYAHSNAEVLPCVSLPVKPCMLSGEEALAALENLSTIKQRCGGNTQVILDLTGASAPAQIAADASPTRDAGSLNTGASHTLTQPMQLEPSVSISHLTIRHATIDFNLAACASYPHCGGGYRSIAAIRVASGTTLRLENSVISDKTPDPAATVGVRVEGQLELYHTNIQDFSVGGVLATPGSVVYGLNSNIKSTGVAVDAYKAQVAFGGDQEPRSAITATGPYNIGVRSRMDSTVAIGSVTIAAERQVFNETGGIIARIIPIPNPNP